MNIITTPERIETAAGTSGYAGAFAGAFEAVKSIASNNTPLTLVAGIKAMAKELGVSDRTVKKYIKNGLPVLRLGGKVFFDRTEVKNYMKKEVRNG